MTQLTPSETTLESIRARRSLARITGGVGLATVVFVLGTSLVNGYQDIEMDAGADEVVAFFRSLDNTLGTVSQFATAVGLIAMLCFALGLALLLRRYEGELPWRSTFLAGVGIISVVSGQIASWDAAVLRSASIDPQLALYAYDLGNISFANGWVAAGAVGFFAGLIIIRTPDLPAWLGWWGLAAGIGSVLARAIWTAPIAFLPVALYWLWVTAISVVLLMGRFAVAATHSRHSAP